jgi:hypothetical protein
VLRLFDDFAGGGSSHALSVVQLRDLCGLDDTKLLKRVLHSLSCMTLKVGVCVSSRSCSCSYQDHHWRIHFQICL